MKLQPLIFLISLRIADGQIPAEAAEGALTQLRWVTAAIAGPERIAIR
jgi:hypothetical protein